MSGQGSSSDCSGPCPTPPQLQLYQTIIFATPVLFALLLLVLFCMLYIRRQRNSNSSQARTQQHNQGLVSTVQIDHGLSKSFRQRLPTVPFDEKFTATREDTQCAVCLGDYQLNEKLQQLPVCKHSFHVQCIDEWLAKNTTCPMCRASLLQEGSWSPQTCIVGVSRGEENRHWEERVMNEIQDGNAHLRGDAYNAVSSSGGMIGSDASRFSVEHAIHIERS